MSMDTASGKCCGGEARLGQSRLTFAATTFPSPPSVPISNAVGPTTAPISNVDGPTTNDAESAADGGDAANDCGNDAIQ